jgi:DNA-binding protein YbaB
MAEGAEMKLMIIQYEGHTETIKTNQPELEVQRAVVNAAGQLVNIIYDGKIIYTRVNR